VTGVVRRSVVRYTRRETAVIRHVYTRRDTLGLRIHKAAAFVLTDVFRRSSVLSFVGPVPKDMIDSTLQVEFLRFVFAAVSEPYPSGVPSRNRSAWRTKFRDKALRHASLIGLDALETTMLLAATERS